MVFPFNNNGNEFFRNKKFVSNHETRKTVLMGKREFISKYVIRTHVFTAQSSCRLNQVHAPADAISFQFKKQARKHNVPFVVPMMELFKKLNSER